VLTAHCPDLFHYIEVITSAILLQKVCSIIPAKRNPYLTKSPFCAMALLIIDDFSLFWYSIILTWSFCLYEKSSRVFSFFMPEYTVIPHYSMENSKAKSILRYGPCVLRNWNLLTDSLYVYFSPFQFLCFF